MLRFGCLCLPEMCGMLTLLRQGGQWEIGRECAGESGRFAGRTGREPGGGHRVAAAWYYDYYYHDYYDYYDYYDELTWRTPAPQA